jgi:amidohydrolase
MDALPLTEEPAGKDGYASERKGAMHACGHDAHTAMLLGCAAALVASPTPSFRVRLLFQAGEEGQFGACKLIEAGFMDGVRAVVGAHVGDLTEELPPGSFGSMPGAMMAAADRFKAVFKGKGGHASAPHRTIDPIPALAEYALALNGLRSRECDQLEPVVISVAALSAGTTHNIIPESAECQGTVRTLVPATRDRIERRVREIGEHLAKAHGLGFEFEWERGYPPLVNDARAYELASAAAASTLGAQRAVRLTRPNMGAEDFAYYAHMVPACFWFMNTQAPDKGIDAPNHNPRFDVDEDLLTDAIAVNLNIAFALSREYAD